jgi:hypothetical protein
MFCKLNRKRAQTTAEYAILIAVVVGALIGMQIYVRRGLQGRIADTVDTPAGYSVNVVGGGVGLNALSFNFDGKQYEPYYLQSGQITQTTGGKRSQSGSTSNLIVHGEDDYTTDRTGGRKSVLGITPGGSR